MTEFKTIVRPSVLRGPMGGYVNQPEITMAIIVQSGVGTTNYDIRPPVGQIWTPTLLQLTYAAQVIAVTPHMGIYLYDGTNAVTLIYNPITGNSLNTTISYGSSATGPILLTHDKYLRITVDNTSGAGSATFHLIASINKVI